jgi:hypothetical protein
MRIYLQGFDQRKDKPNLKMFFGESWGVKIRLTKS